MTLSKILKTISASEWRFVFLVSLIMIFSTSVLLLYGILITPDDKIFTGIHFSFPNDWFVYYSYIEQTIQGNILFDNLFTHYEHLATVNILWLGVGMVAKFFSLSAFEAFNVVRILLIPVFYIVLYTFLSYLFVDVAKRKFVTLMMSFSSGLGFLLIDRVIRFPANFHEGVFQWPMDLWVVESNTFLTLYYSPHFIAALILILSIFFLSVLYVSNKKISYSIGAGVLAFILFSFHPFHVPTIFGVLLAYFAVLIFRDQKIHWYLIKHYLIVFFLAAPAIFYFLYLLKFDFVMGQKALQNMTFTPPVWITIFSYGLPGALAALGVYYLIKQKKFSNKSIFIITWAVVQLLLIYLPVNYQRRMTQGLQIPITILATISLLALYSVVIKRKTATARFIYEQRFLALIFIGLLLVGSTIFQLSADAVIYSSGKDLAYIDKDIISAAQWLKTTPKDSVVFNSADNIINVLPAYSGRRVFVGHGVETPLSAQKQYEVNWFFSKNRSEQSEINYLTNRSVDYIFYSPAEKLIGEFDPSIKSYLTEDYRNATVIIYKVL